MTTRTFSLTMSENGLDNLPLAGAPYVVELLTPGGVPVVNLEGREFQNGILEAGNLDGSGNATATVVYTGDLRQAGPIAGVAVTCYLQITVNGYPTLSPGTFAYASSIALSTWQPTPSTTGTTRMLLGLNRVDNSPSPGTQVTLDITATVIRPDGRDITAGQPQTFTADANGNITMDLVPTLSLVPNNSRYKLRYNDGTLKYFTVPVNPTGYQGAYAGGTAYGPHAGTFASPADIVLYAGVLYQSILLGTGHQPDISPTYWQPFLGELVDWNIDTAVTPGSFGLTTSNITHDTSLPAITHDPVGSPVTLHDDVANLAWRTNPTALTYTPALQGATDNPVATYTHQIGRYFLLGKRCFISIVVTTSTMTKTTTADPLRVTLPLAAANVASNVDLLTARAENGTAVAVGSQAYTTPNASYLQIKQINPAAASADITYAATTPGIGVLTNAITVLVTGSYETV